MWNIRLEEVYKKLETSAWGINERQAETRLKKYGENRFEEKRKKNVFSVFFKQMSDSMVIILLVAALVSVIVSFLSGEKDYTDAAIILAIVVFNAITGTVQEFKAEHALEALKKMNSSRVTVIREGKEREIDTAKLVPGDVIRLNTGDYVPADARLTEAVRLTTDESALTGETEEVKKDVSALFDLKTPIAEIKNMVWANTIVSGGRGKAVVTETGMNSQTGKVAGLILNSESPETPLQLRLKKTGKVLGIAVVFICGIIFLMGLLRKQPALEMFMTSVSLAVAAIPEGLTATITIMLAIGVQKMAKKNAVMRKLPAVETLGSATVICTDKTGTLTKNEMTVTDIYGDKTRLLEFGVLCNDERGATEKALVCAAEKNKIYKRELDGKFRRVDEIPFTSKRKLMTTVHKLNDGYMVISKGAPEKIIPLCNLSNDRKSVVLKKNSEMASLGKRVIAMAFKEVSALNGGYEENLIFVGLAGMNDPPREGVTEAVKSCKTAGIKVVMITGDQKDTAEAIAKETGILRGSGYSLSGKDIDVFTDERLAQEVEKCRVFYRTTPEHKMRIVKAFQSRGEVVAMTGDGVNDAPALKYADIGCAMGKCGTDVAKGAADMVMTDDNFATIVHAVAQGRGIYSNIKKAVRFLLSSNIGEIFTIFTAIFFGRESPLSAICLLWMNLVTDSLPAVALGLQPPDKDIMCKKPINKNKSIFADGLGFTIFIEGIMIGIIASIAYIIGKNIFASEMIGKTMTFCTLSMSQLFHAVGVESEHSIFSKFVSRNKYMLLSFFVCMGLQMSVVVFLPFRQLFGTTALSVSQWLCVLTLSSLPLIISEIEKIFKNKQNT